MIYALMLCITGSFLISADILNSNNVEPGYTGADGITCNNCHGGNEVNSPGGSVVINDLPATYTPGTTYNFSVTINHSSANRRRWGFAMKAVANGKPSGTFSTINNNVYIIMPEREIGHSAAPTTPFSASYTFNGLSWTAPLSPTADEKNITFYVAGNAANGSGSSSDFIYTATRSMTQTNTSLTENNIQLDKISTLREGKKVIIQLALKKNTTLQIALFNMNGQRVLNKANQKFSSGTYTIELDGSILAPGTYIVSVQNEKEKVTGKITL